MANRIGVASNRKILDLYNDMKSGNLILRPRFQRKLVWNDSHKENFIDTILRGLPFPEIYLAAGDIDLETQKANTLVVDGQQRLNTIYDYIRGSKDLVFKKIQTFKDLSSKEKTDFYDYQVVVRDLERIDDTKLIEIFNRINSVQYALNAIEINNALYEGAFITCAKEILEKSFFKDIDIFSETEYSRMKDLEFILLIMSTIQEGGYFNGVKEVGTYVEEYDDEYPGSKTMKEDFLNCLKLFADLEVPPDSIWLRKASFFTLIAELIFFKRKFAFFPDKKSLKLKLLSLEDKIIEEKTADKEKNKYAKYYNYIFSGTASRAARVVRGELVREFLLQLK